MNRVSNMDNTTRITIDNQVIEDVPIPAVISQEDSFCPNPFNFLTKEILQEIISMKMRHRLRGKPIDMLCFADDAVINRNRRRITKINITVVSQQQMFQHFHIYRKIEMYDIFEGTITLYYSIR